MHPGRSSVSCVSGIPEAGSSSPTVTSPTEQNYYYGYYPYYPIYSVSQDSAGVYNVYHTWPASVPSRNKPRNDKKCTNRGKIGSSTVAIDNKIEQAMDLVKSHLMYAVREEVEVLKEQIKELMDKNQQLEYENQILKNSASPETLSKLTSPSSSS